MVDIKGLDKAEVLSALHRAPKAQGMGILLDRGPLSVEDCRAILANIGTEESDEFNERLYDRDLGEGAAERAIAPLRANVPA